MPAPGKILICKVCHTLTGHVRKTDDRPGFVLFACCFCGNVVEIDLKKARNKADKVRRNKREAAKSNPFREER